MPILYTSLNEIKSFHPCASGWKTILKAQNKTEADDVLFPLIDTVESNTISDVCWLLGKRKSEIEIAAKFARMCADSVSHLKNANSSDASAYASDASDYAFDAYADYAAHAYADYAHASADSDYAAHASARAAHASAHASEAQIEKNKQFMIQCITDFQDKT